MYEIWTNEGCLSALYSRNQFVIAKKSFRKSMMCHRQQFHFERQLGNYSIWVVRDTTDVRVYKSVRFENANVKQLSDFVHQNVTGAVHVTISRKKKKLFIKYLYNILYMN